MLRPKSETFLRFKSYISKHVLSSPTPSNHLLFMEDIFGAGVISQFNQLGKGSGLPSNLALEGKSLWP